VKSCPFCGERPALKEKTMRQNGCYIYPTWVACENTMCRVNPKTEPNLYSNAAKRLWNRRADHGERVE